MDRCFRQSQYWVFCPFGERLLHLLESFDVCVIIGGPERATVFNGWYYEGF